MRHGSNELAGGIARQPGIGIQCEDVANGGEDLQIADDLAEGYSRLCVGKKGGSL
jgi:hypothetical protein